MIKLSIGVITKVYGVRILDIFPSWENFYKFISIIAYKDYLIINDLIFVKKLENYPSLV